MTNSQRECLAKGMPSWSTDYPGDGQMIISLKEYALAQSARISELEWTLTTLRECGCDSEIIERVLTPPSEAE